MCVWGGGGEGQCDTYECRLVTESVVFEFGFQN